MQQILQVGGVFNKKSGHEEDKKESDLESSSSDDEEENKTPNELCTEHQLQQKRDKEAKKLRRL